MSEEIYRSTLMRAINDHNTKSSSNNRMLILTTILVRLNHSVKQNKNIQVEIWYFWLTTSEEFGLQWYLIRVEGYIIRIFQKISHFRLTNKAYRMFVVILPYFDP